MHARPSCSLPNRPAHHQTVPLTTKPSCSPPNRPAHHQTVPLTTKPSCSPPDRPAHYQTVLLTTKPFCSPPNRPAHYQTVLLTTRPSCSPPDPAEPVWMPGDQILVSHIMLRRARMVGRTWYNTIVPKLTIFYADNLVFNGPPSYLISTYKRCDISEAGCIDHCLGFQARR